MGKEDIETVPKFGVTRGMTGVVLPVCGMRFPGIGEGPIMGRVWALTGRLVVDINNNMDNIMVVTTID